jgi:hypothetical protein
MNDSSKSILLVALSEGFAQPHLFAAKLDKIIGGMRDVEVVLVQDDLGIANEYFRARAIPARTERVSTRMAAKSVVSACTHVVVLWGGNDLSDIVYFARLLQKKSRIIPLRITTVRNKDKNQEFDVYIGRGTKWGNPFVIGHGPDGLSREEVIRRYKDHFEREILPDPEKHAALLSLRGYRLGCHCKPLPCHGDIIASYLNTYVDPVEDDAGDSGQD